MIRVSHLPWALTAALLAASGVLAGPSINVGLKTTFSPGPYLLELLETAAGENATSYFPLLDRIANGDFSKATSDKELYETFLRVVRDDDLISSPEALSTFKLALSMRSAAPRIEAHYQYYATGVEPNLGGGIADGCDSWVLFNERQHCSPSLAEAKDKSLGSSQQKNLPFDRSLGAGNDAILYADITAPSFGPYHKALAERARKGEISYRVRYRRTPNHRADALPVSGYGVELALKKTDYIVLDDRDSEKSSDAAPKPQDTEVVLDVDQEVADLKALSKSELSALGLKASSFIMQSEKPFETLVKIIQDFPKYSSAIASHNVSKDFLAEHEANRIQMIPGGANLLWMNGVQLIERQIEPFNLVDMLRRERKLINGVKDLGLTGKQAVNLLGHHKVASAKSDGEPSRFDWRDTEEEGKAILWLNNIEKDERYEDFPDGDYLTALLQRTFPGQVPPIRRDIFNVIMPLDLTKAGDVETILRLWDFVNRLLPIRFGVVPVATTEQSSQQTKIVRQLAEAHGIDAAMQYLWQSLEAKKLASPDAEIYVLTTDDNTALPGEPFVPFVDVLQSETREKEVKYANAWVRRLNADGLIFVNGMPLTRDENWMQTMGVKVSGDLQIVQQHVFMQMIEEDMWMPKLFLHKAMPRRNPYIYPEDGKSLRMLDVNKMYTEHDDLFSQLPVLEAYADSTKENWAVLTVVANLETEEGMRLAASALKFRSNNPGVRMDILHNPLSSSGAGSLIAVLKGNEAQLAEVETVEELQKLLIGGSADATGYGAALASFVSGAAIKPGSQALIINGRLVGPFRPELPFTDEDFQYLLEFEQQSRILPVYAAIVDLDLTDKVSGPLAAAKLTSITALSTISDLPEGIFEAAPSIRMSPFDEWNSTYTAMEVGNAETASIHLVGLVNPASEQGQRWAPLLKIMSELDGVYVKIFLNPRDKLEELPVKRFYRYVLKSEPTFDEAGHVEALGATFTGVPSEALLTLGMDVPPAWLVAAKVSVHDLDNIKLGSIKADVDATYELENILMEGHSREGQGSPPRGAQLVIGTEKDAHLDDTIIMANLGYFQFKSNPGVYNIQLKEGPSSEVYTIESAGAMGWNPVPGDEGTDVALMEFTGTTLYPRLLRKPGMEEVDVLGEAEEGAEENIVAKGLKFAEGLFGGKAKETAKEISDQEHAEINIFSVASGHLYERMLNIMMVSVMRHTNHTVKFWFIEQFLSPSFKDFIPHMAKQYGFKYEMVTYKWPHWLRQQKEKQREIWGYKILFLDVLFPLSLDKVIFVDADQIVRTDMIDLVNYDLKGAPYGFTPMCDSRTEMEGFRFWKQGYWQKYLRGMPYHISALYVVDLRRFRALASGDRLRQQYHTLSSDPASLANLDQDLPNHMQFVIPIHSLSQEWLWCETWCSDESLKEARTIDLCNNPLTKEPKLDRARRQVPEWTVYDDEIAALDRRRKGLPVEAKGHETQKAVVAEAGEKNPKSRRLEEEPAHKKDEL